MKVFLLYKMFLTSEIKYSNIDVFETREEAVKSMNRGIDGQILVYGADVSKIERHANGAFLINSNDEVEFGYIIEEKDIM